NVDGGRRLVSRNGKDQRSEQACFRILHDVGSILGEEHGRSLRVATVQRVGNHRGRLDSSRSMEIYKYEFGFLKAIQGSRRRVACAHPEKPRESRLASPYAISRRRPDSGLHIAIRKDLVDRYKR